MAFQSRPLIGSLERIGSTFLNRISTLLARDQHDLLGYLGAKRSIDLGNSTVVRAVVVDGLQVVAQTVPDMTVQIKVGMAIVPAAGSSGVVGAGGAATEDSNIQLVNKRTLTAAQAITAAGGTTRYDLIEIAAADSADVNQIVDTWSAALKKFIAGGAPTAVVKHAEGTIFYTVGAGGGTVPAPTAGRIPLAAIRTISGQTSITQDDVLDLRVLLAELQSRGGHPNELDVGQLDVDVLNGGTLASPQNLWIQMAGKVGGLPVAARTWKTLNVQFGGTNAANTFGLFDSQTITNILGAVGPEWIYFYMVAQDDQGYRYSRSRSIVGGAGGTDNDFSHTGLLVISHVPPSLANGGSMAPSAALHLPLTMSNGTCTPGTGSAVCIGMAYYGASTSRFQYGLRSRQGKAELVASDGAPMNMTSWTLTAETVASTVGTSAVQANWDTTAPKGPLSYELYFLITCNNVPASVGCRREITVYDDTAAAPADRRRAEIETSVMAQDALTKVEMIVPRMAVGRVPALRGSSSTGAYIQVRVFYGATGPGAGVAAVTPTARLMGYEWPSGPVPV